MIVLNKLAEDSNNGSIKLLRSLVPAACFGSRLDKNWNKNRPLYNASPATTYPDLSSLFPHVMRRDPALFNLAEGRYFKEINGKRQFNPIKNHRALFSDF